MSRSLPCPPPLVCRRPGSRLCILSHGSAGAAQELSFVPFHQNGIYALGEKAGWTVTLAQGATASSHYTYIIKRNNFDVIAAAALDLSSGSATIETALSEPAMLYVEVRADAPPTSPAQGRQAAAPVAVMGTVVHLGAAIAPTQLQPSVPRPADFDAFWDAKLKALAAIPINPVLTPTRPAARAWNCTRSSSTASFPRSGLPR